MATISSMTNNTYLMYKMAEKNGLNITSGTSSSSDASSTSSLISSLSSSNANASSSTSALYGSSTSASDMQTLSSIKNGYAGLVSSYEDTKSTFNTELKSTLSDLTSSAKTVANMNFDFSASDITENSDGTKTYSDGLKSAIKNIKSLVSNYNDTLGFFSDNKSVSNRASALATEFADTTYRANQYAAIGVNVDSKTGELSVDEDKLATALTTESGRVENTLGQNGLAGKAESHAALANYQSDKIFPSATQMFGNETTAASLYTGSTLLSISSYATTGNLLNMLF